MKRDTKPFEITALREPIRPNASAQEEERTLPIESMHLYTEQIMNRASATTQRVNAILAQKERPYFVRHWGINE